MKIILNLLCVLILLTIANFFCGCYSGEEPPISCDQVVVGHIKIPDSLSSCSWYQKDGESIQYINSLGKSLTYDRFSLTTKYVPHNCDSVFSRDYYKAEFRSETISPNLSMASWASEQNSNFVPTIMVNAGGVAIQILADSMIVQKPNFIEYFDNLDSLGTHFEKCYHVWRKPDGTSNNEGIIFSNQDGILAFYKDGISWHRE